MNQVKQRAIGGGGGVGVTALSFFSQEHDYLVVVPLGKAKDALSDEDIKRTNVAKPFLLQRVAENDGGERIRDDITFTYETDDDPPVPLPPGTLTARLPSEPNDLVEEWLIGPAYVAGDVVLVVAMATGVKTLPTVDEPDGEPIGLQELDAGRRWEVPLEDDA